MRRRRIEQPHAIRPHLTNALDICSTLIFCVSSHRRTLAFALRTFSLSPTNGRIVSSSELARLPSSRSHGPTVRLGVTPTRYHVLGASQTACSKSLRRRQMQTLVPLLPGPSPRLDICCCLHGHRVVRYPLCLSMTSRCSGPHRILPVEEKFSSR